MTDQKPPQADAAGAAGSGQQARPDEAAGWEQAYPFAAWPGAGQAMGAATGGPAPNVHGHQGATGQQNPGWPGAGGPYAPPYPGYWPQPGYPPMAPPPYPGYGYPGAEAQGGNAPGAGAGGHQAGGSDHHGMHNFINEISNGGNGLSSLSKLFNFNDGDFLKGAAFGALAVLVLTNEDVKKAILGIFNGAAGQNGATEQNGEGEG